MPDGEFAIANIPTALPDGRYRIRFEQGTPRAEETAEFIVRGRVIRLAPPTPPPTPQSFWIAHRLNIIRAGVILAVIGIGLWAYFHFRKPAGTGASPGATSGPSGMTPDELHGLAERFRRVDAMLATASNETVKASARAEAAERKVDEVAKAAKDSVSALQRALDEAKAAATNSSPTTITQVVEKVVMAPAAPAQQFPPEAMELLRQIAATSQATPTAPSGAQPAGQPQTNMAIAIAVSSQPGQQPVPAPQTAPALQGQPSITVNVGGATNILNNSVVVPIQVNSGRSGYDTDDAHTSAEASAEAATRAGVYGEDAAARAQLACEKIDRYGNAVGTQYGGFTMPGVAQLHPELEYSYRRSAADHRRANQVRRWVPAPPPQAVIIVTNGYSYQYTNSQYRLRRSGSPL